jgi:SSS family solute:Na+ symporter
VITAIEAMRQRFRPRRASRSSRGCKSRLGIIYAGIWLNALGVFFSASFGLDLTWTIIATGLVVLVMALLGGSWAVLASDFIQVLILMPVCLVVAVLGVLLKLGGFGAFLDRIPVTSPRFQPGLLQGVSRASGASRC